MNNTSKFRAEYIFRINKVIDHIETNLDNSLNLQNLAEIANFSPFHFHRIFSTFMGETLNGYVKRKRIEKAASKLISDPDTTISEIAYSHGFSSSSVFCRVFKDHFKLNVKDFREIKREEIRKNSQLESKIDKLMRRSPEYLCSEDLIIKWKNIMKTNIEVKQMPEQELLYVNHVGPFELIGNAYGKLMNWAGPRGLLSREFNTVTVYHDDPSVTDISKLRQSACITVEKDVKAEGEFGRMNLPEGNYCVGRFEINDKEFEMAWNSVCAWMADNGYQPEDGLPYELYHNDHMEHPERKFILDICVPVKPL